MKFDYIIGNPPYLGGSGLYLKILNKVTKITTEQMNFIHPAVPYFNKKPQTIKNKLMSEFISNVDQFETHITIDDGLSFVGNGINITNSLARTKLTKKKGDTKITYLNGKSYVTDVKGINKLQIPPSDYEELFKIYEKLATPSLGDILERCNDRKLQEKGTYFQLSLIRGNVHGSQVKSDFYTFFSKNMLKNTRLQKDIRLGFPCKENQIDNIEAYLSTKFARFGLSFLKFDFNMQKSTMKLVPAPPNVSFDVKYTNEMLLEKFIPKHLQHHILSLPDFELVNEGAR